MKGREGRGRGEEVAVSGEGMYMYNVHNNELVPQDVVKRPLAWHWVSSYSDFLEVISSRAAEEIEHCSEVRVSDLQP